ncbi:PREDICTED: F-box/LRR-repeat protein At1g67190-like [Camelina sativa]|uniref:F-box/LRR-repeat protein At1g67190-like n=1 Tax=Camelina sativa TaxID=90675 RepID=A0ABM0SRY1_CAMSA|nr:PREDICTED: F-box/LRR-repeat protein At1g67190-like [Camelina sativa]
MDYLPVEVIGNILSRLGGARDVVIASATCRKWREGYRKHLQSLTFNSADWPFYRDLTTNRLEILITQTIFQTTGLQGLSIVMDDANKFSAGTVMAWLMYTRDTLRRLSYNVRTTPNVNILEICGRQKLEDLVLAHNSITGVEPSFQRFPCLRSLSLSYVSISALDLNLLLSACPLIESLELVSLEIAMSDAQVTIELSSPTLKSVYFDGISLDKFILEADSIEFLHMKDCVLELFELIGNGTLKHFKLDDVSVILLDIMETSESLEVVDVNHFTMVWPKFYQMISRSQKLRKLRLWDVVFDDDDEIIDLESIAAGFSQLTHLSLSYDLKDGAAHYSLQGTTQLVNVTVLELGWTVINDVFSIWVEELLRRCPNLKKLIIYGVVSETKTQGDCQILATFTWSIVQLMRKYIHVEVQFEYE